MKNYDAWKINPNDFYKESGMKGKIKFLVRFGILAPSSHNSQPWKFRISGNETHIFADWSRQLPVSDESGRMMYEALGCAIENIKIAADSYGLLSTIEYNPTLNNSTKDYVAKIIFSGNKNTVPHNLALVQAIIKRTSYRGKYGDQKIQQSFFEGLNTLSIKNELRLSIFQISDEKAQIALIAGNAMRNKMREGSFRKELASWMRSNFTKKYDGMPGSGHGMKLIISLLAPMILRHIDVSQKEKKRIMQRVINFPAIAIISSIKDTALQWIQSGRYLERMLIEISAHGMDGSIIAAPIEDKEGRIALQRIVNKQTQANMLPQAFFGFGFSKKLFPHSPRRLIEEALR